MSLASSCVALCAPFTTVAAVLLLMMSHMLRSGNWTFEVLATKNGWDRETKANTCMRGGFLYLFTSLTLWIAALFHAPARRLWMQLQWSTRREDDPSSRAALLHSDDTAASHAGERYERRASTRLHSRMGSGRREEVKEMSALDWVEDVPPPAFPTAAAAATAGSFLEDGDMRNSAAAGAPMAHRFPYSQRIMADASGGGSDNSMRASGDPGGACATPANGTTGAGTVSWAQSRGLRSRGSISAASGYVGSGAGRGLRFNNTSFNALSPSITTGADSVDDVDFMSDVEVDGTRHYTTPQVRASAWGLHRPTTNMETSGGTGVGGRQRAQTQRFGNNGVPVTERGDHAQSGSTTGPATPAARLPTLTSLWQRGSSGLSLPEARRASDRRVGPERGAGAKSKST